MYAVIKIKNTNSSAMISEIGLLLLFGFFMSIFTAKICSANDMWLGKDKFQHFVTSAVIAAGVTSMLQSETQKECLAPAVGISITLSIGLLKEMYDKYGKKTIWSWKDMAWNLFGGTTGTLLVSKCE